MIELEAVIKAIEARGWLWRYNSRDREAVVWPPNDHWIGDWELRRVGQGAPTEALLTAYLAAVEGAPNHSG